MALKGFPGKQRMILVHYDSLSHEFTKTKAGTCNSVCQSTLYNLHLMSLGISYNFEAEMSRYESDLPIVTPV